MADETPEQRLARLEEENKRLREQMEQRKPGQLRLKVSEKGGVSVYGLGRFPVTLYYEQWTRLLEATPQLRAFLSHCHISCPSGMANSTLDGVLQCSG